MSTNNIMTKTNLCKATITLFLILTSLTACAQPQAEPSHLVPPKTYWQSFGFQKQPKQVGIGYYKSDSLGYEPAMLEVYNFNEDGFITQKYIRIFGEYGSETVNNYVYSNGVLDSINTLASAQNFNRQEKFHYDKSGQLTHITANGKFADYTDTYTYDNNGMVATIERKWKSRGSKKTFFKHNGNYVREKETAPDGKITESYTVYDGDELFASFTLGGRPVVTFHDSYHRSDVEVEVNTHALNYVLEQRKLKQSNPEAFNKLMTELQGKPTSREVFDVPAMATNEDGDWTKRLQIDRRFSKGERRLVFKKLVYADGTESGSTDYDLLFERKTERMK